MEIRREGIRCIEIQLVDNQRPGIRREEIRREEIQRVGIRRVETRRVEIQRVGIRRVDNSPMETPRLGIPDRRFLGNVSDTIEEQLEGTSSPQRKIDSRNT